MQKALPYILALLLLVAVIFLMTASKKAKNREFDERITLRRQDKIPYGDWVAYQNLNHLFPHATISTNRHEPGYWDSLSNYEDGQALIIITREFQASEYEMKKIVNFVEHGNDVFISTRYLSAATDEILGCSSSSLSLSFIGDLRLQDSLGLTLLAPYVKQDKEYGYPGKTFNSFFDRIDTATTDILGRDDRGRTNFVRMRAGKGHLYVQLEPLAFSNYFLLHGNNIGYYENALSLIPSGVNRVVWDEYYLYHVNRPDKSGDSNRNWLSVLMNTKNASGQKSFGAAIWVLLLLLLVYVLMEMRRKQRYIPVITKPRNDSLDFVKTVGRLYYDKGDHRNLARKMSAYFMEYVRNRYKMATGTLDDTFVKNLQFKSGMDETELQGIVTFIRYSEDAPAITQQELAHFHRQLENFYKIA